MQYLLHEKKGSRAPSVWILIRASVQQVRCKQTRNKKQFVALGADKVLKDAKAIGVDHIVRIDSSESMDSNALQSVLASVVKGMDATVVYCGKSAADTGAGSTGPGLAAVQPYSSGRAGLPSPISLEGDRDPARECRILLIQEAQ